MAGPTTGSIASKASSRPTHRSPSATITVSWDGVSGRGFITSSRRNSYHSDAGPDTGRADGVFRSSRRTAPRNRKGQGHGARNGAAPARTAPDGYDFTDRPRCRAGKAPVITTWRAEVAGPISATTAGKGPSSRSTLSVTKRVSRPSGLARLPTVPATSVTTNAAIATAAEGAGTSQVSTADGTGATALARSTGGGEDGTRRHRALLGLRPVTISATAYVDGQAISQSPDETELGVSKGTASAAS